MSTIDDHGNVHSDTNGQFTGHIRGEADAGAVLATDAPLKPGIETIRQHLREHSEDLVTLIADRIAYLGSKTEWSSDDNFDTTELIAAFASQVADLPTASDQDDEALAFYGTAARELGYEVEEVDQDDTDEIDRDVDPVDLQS